MFHFALYVYVSPQGYKLISYDIEPVLQFEQVCYILKKT